MDGPLIWSFMLLLIAIGILVIEIFVPSGGLLGLAAAATFVASIVVAFSVSLNWGFAMIMIVTAIVPVVISLAVRVWPRTPIGRKIMNRIPGEPPPDVLPDNEHYQQLQALDGRVGRAITTLLPNGIIEIDGRKYDAVSHGGAIEEGLAVEVFRIETGKLQVRLSDQSPEEDVESLEKQADKAPVAPLEQSIDELGIESLEDPLA